jgi:hypothetical protein
MTTLNLWVAANSSTLSTHVFETESECEEFVKANPFFTMSIPTWVQLKGKYNG